MSKHKAKSDRKWHKQAERRLSAIEGHLSGVRFNTAALIDYKIGEFARLGDDYAIVSKVPTIPAAASVPPFVSSVTLAVIATFSDLLKEFDRIKGKVQAALDTLQPPDAGEPGMPVVPPVPPTPGTRKLRDALRKIGEAKAAAENLEPESAREKLKQAKDLIGHRDVRAEFRRIRQARSWYDILEELQRSIDYLDGILK